MQAAVATGRPIVPVYVLDDEAPGRWSAGAASRWWLHESLAALDAALRQRGSRLVLAQGPVLDVLVELARETEASALYWSRSYEPWAVKLEQTLHRTLEGAGIRCRRFSGHLLFEPEDIATGSGDPFRVFTPFCKACMKAGAPGAPAPAPASLPPVPADMQSDTLNTWGLQPKTPDWAETIKATWTPGEEGARAQLQSFRDTALKSYKTDRDRPDREGTSRLSPHLHFGEISPRQVWHGVSLAAGEQGGKSDAGAEAFLRELVWREFSAHLLFHWTHIPESPFRSEYSAFPWSDDAHALEAWQKGMTGYPVVDAGMRQLWATGWMHNRVRMIVASFLVKDLLIPWQKGEDWFWATLVDADLASNAANWQWVAGCGADAAPYFRIFNPVLQGKKFDPEGAYVKAWVPELAKMPKSHIHAPWAAPKKTLAKAGVTLGDTYPTPIVDHKQARARALAAYEAVKEAKG